MLYRNLKNNKFYEVINDAVIDATNNSNNTIMVLYKDDQGKLFVREKAEFHQKFVKV